MSPSACNESLLSRFIASWPVFDDMIAREHIDQIESTFGYGEVDGHGKRRWKPAKVESNRSLLDPVYAELPAKFPRLFECLVLSYRWPEVDLGLFTLMANPMGPDLKGMLVRDRHLSETLIPAGFTQFGKGPGGDYDPVCFDASVRKKSRNYRIVKIDHEEILCNYRLKIVAELAPTFESLVMRVIEAAEKKLQS